MRTASGKTISLPVPHIPDHELLREIGEGSYGKVWLARNIMGYRAVKVIYRAALESERPFEREFDGLKKFERISRTHPGLVNILQVGRNDPAGYFYYVMELADDQRTGQPFQPEGGGLAEFVPRSLRTELDQRGKLPLLEATRIGLALSEALGYLHRQGLVHRDIKPSNIIFVNHQPKLADVGLVTDIGERSMVGTVGYMAPEQPGRPEADLYSLGRLLYVTATGLAVNDFPKLPDDVVAEADPALWELNQIWLKAAAERVEDRYRTAAELQLHLTFLQAGQSVIAHLRMQRMWRRLKVFAPAGVAVLLLALGAGWLRARNQKDAAIKREREAGALVAYGSIALKGGEYLTALPAFAGALQLDQADPLKADTHRTRLATMLAAAPRLRHIWFQEQPQRSLQFNRDGSLLFMGGPEGRFHFFHTSNGTVASPPVGTGVDREEAVLSPDDRRVAIFASMAGTNVGLWDLRTGARTRVLEPTPGTKVYCAGFSPDGRWVAAGLEDGRILAWEVATGVEIFELKGHREAVMGVAFDHAGRRLASASRDQRVIVWKVTEGERLLTFTNHTGWVYQAVFSPDDRAIASGSYDRQVWLWDAETGRELAPPMSHPDAVYGVAFSPDGSRLIAACLGFTARLWDRAGKQAAPTLYHSSRVSRVAFSPGGRQVATACSDGTARLWELPSPTASPLPYSLVLSPDGRLSASTSNRTVTVREGLGPRVISSFELPERPSQRLQFDAKSEAILAVLPVDHGPNPPSWEARLWRVADGRSLGSAISLPQSATQVVVNAGATLVAAGPIRGGVGEAVRLRVFDTQTAAAGPEVLLRPPMVHCLFSPDGRYLAVADAGRFQLYAAPAFRPVFPVAVPVVMPSVRLAFSPDGRRVAAGWNDATLNPGGAALWESATGRRLTPDLTHRDGVNWVEFSADGRRLVTGCEDFSAMIWDATTGCPVIPDHIHHDDSVMAAGFGAGGRWVFTVGSNQDGTARVWDAQTGDPVTPPFRHGRRVVAGQFTADASALVTRTYDGRCWLWPLPRERRPAEDVSQLAQLLAAHQTDLSGNLLPQSKESLRRAWNRLSQLYPADFAGE